MRRGASAGGIGDEEPTALVADSSAAESGALARALCEIGYRVICAATPLEMIHHLEHRAGDIGLIVLGSSLGRCQGDELASFLAETHPRLRRVLVAKRAAGARATARAILGSALDKPWAEDLVRSALAPTPATPGATPPPIPTPIPTSDELGGERGHEDQDG
jgi:DNA-binding NtrC family response regulator